MSVGVPWQPCPTNAGILSGHTLDRQDAVGLTGYSAYSDFTEGETEARPEKQLARSPRNRAGVCFSGSVPS